MSRRRRFNFLALFANAALVATLLTWVAVFVLGVMSHRPGGVEWELGEEERTRLLIHALDGRVVLGIYQVESPRWWRVAGRRDSSMQALVQDGESYLAIGLTCLGIAAPVWGFTLILMIVPAWRWMLFQQQRQARRRQADGLCPGCGYDVRASNERCPECGETLPPLALRGAVLVNS